MASESRTAVLAALIGNLLIALAKLGAGLLARSSALVAESVHSFSDVGNQVLLLFGLARSKRPATAKHPFGHGKAAYVWPLLVAVLLFGVAGGWSVFEGIEKVRHPHDLGDIRVGLAVLGAAFVIESWTLWVAVSSARKQQRASGTTSVRAFLRQNRDATLLTVIVEDGLALAGLPIAAAALLLSKWTGNAVWDGIGTLAIGALLMGFALFLGKRVHDLLLGVGLTATDQRRLIEIALAEPGVHEVADIRSMYVGPKSVLVGAELKLDPDVKGRKVQALVAKVEAQWRQAVPALAHVYIESHEDA